MNKRLMKKFALLAATGGVVLQLAGCVSGLLNSFIQDAIGIVIGGIVVQLLRAVTPATDMAAMLL